MYRVSVLCLAAIAGCGLETLDIEISTSEQATQSDCDSEGMCPGNSPVVATFPFIDLFSIPSTQPNAQGFVISHFMINGLPHGFRVQNGRISGHRGNRIVTGSGLNGAELWLRRQNRQYVLRIISVVPVTMWANLNPAQPAPQVEAYEMNWADVIGSVPTSQWRNVCQAAKLPYDSPDLSYASSTVPPYVTFVVEGERIDPKTKTIYGWDTRWFNLGCAGHTLAKMYLTGHVGIASSMGFVTTQDERQTMMKMLSADYCGRGYAFTVPGVELRWQDHRGWMTYGGSVTTIEARWTRDGAACLDWPRTEAHETDESRAKWPTTWALVQEINALCPALFSRVCAAPPEGFFGYHLVTANR